MPGSIINSALHLQEWSSLSPEFLERQCRQSGVLYESANKDGTIDRLVARHVYTLYGASGPPADVLEAAASGEVAADRSSGGAAAPAGDSREDSGGGGKGGLVVGYESGSDAGAESPPHQLADGQTLFSAQPDGSGGHNAAAQAAAAVEKAARDAEAARQWEAVDDEPAHPAEAKPMSQILFEKQARLCINRTPLP